jgi:multidrug efflux pump subunit AcrA (membrane-fusion protein)
VRRSLIALVAVAVLVAAGLVVVLGDSGDDAAAESSTAGGVATGTVERRTLAEHVTATGTIGYAGEATVLARLSGTVTALPAVGDVVGRGERLYAVSSEPVLLM